MDLFDVNIDALKGIAEEYYSNPAGLIIKNGKPTTRVNRKSYEVWTTDTIENDMVKTANHFIKAYNELAKYTKTYLWIWLVSLLILFVSICVKGS